MSDVSGRVILKTALHGRTAALCASDMWTRVCSFAVPQVYTSEREECEAMVARAAIADMSARYCWRFEGPDAAAFLGFATTHDAGLIGLGQTARVLWCDDSGSARGEGLLARLDEQCFELTTVVGDHAWFADGASGFNVQVSDRTGQRGGIGLRGPFAEAILELAGFLGASERGGAEAPAGQRAVGWRQSQVLLLRVAEGFELWMDGAGAGLVWDRLMRVGAGFGLQAVGNRVLEHARIEAAVPLPGTDWIPAQFAARAQDLRSPFDLGVEPDVLRRFNGSDALAQRRRGCGSRLVQLSSARPLARGELIGKGGSAGSITSVASSPATERHLALGWIRDDLARPGSPLGLPGTSGALDIHVVRLCQS
jgi:glycine cleavage system aminomethyltransferase T